MIYSLKYRDVDAWLLIGSLCCVGLFNEYLLIAATVMTAHALHLTLF